MRSVRAPAVLLPDGQAEVVDEQGTGVVRAEGTVVAEFRVENVGDGWYVTTVETCAVS